MKSAKVSQGTSFVAKKRMAREQFIEKLIELQSRDLTGHPIHSLHFDIWPGWHALMYPASPPRRRRLFYGATDENKVQRENNAARLLSQWACNFLLLEKDDRDDFRPAGWIVEFARGLCLEWSAEKLEVEKTSRSWRQDSGHFGYTANLKLADHSSLIVPMQSPFRQQNETRKQFEARAKKALSEFLLVLKRNKHLATPDALEGDHEKVRRRRRLDPNHFEWLILYQCCGWQLKQIWEAMPTRIGTSEGRAIFEAVKEKSDLLGLVLRRSRIKPARGSAGESKYRDFLE